MIQIFDIIDSTNTEAKRQIEAATGEELKGLHKKTIAAYQQTAGRGRMNRPFFSPAKSGIYFSVIYRPRPESLKTFNPAMYTVTAAVAVSEAIEEIYGVQSGIKWVNDIYMNGKKVSGILTEGVMNRNGEIAALVIGIGINISTSREDFPEEIKNKAGAIISGGDNKINFLLECVVQKLLEKLDSAEEKKDFSEICNEYRKKSVLINKKVMVKPVINQDENNYEAMVLDITDDAKLKVSDAQGNVKLLDSGEVSLLFLE